MEALFHVIDTFRMSLAWGAFGITTNYPMRSNPMVFAAFLRAQSNGDTNAKTVKCFLSVLVVATMWR